MRWQGLELVAEGLWRQERGGRSSTNSDNQQSPQLVSRTPGHRTLPAGYVHASYPICPKAQLAAARRHRVSLSCWVSAADRSTRPRPAIAWSS